MANGMLLGFVAVAATVVGALDYTMQTRRADVGFGELGLGAYVATFGERFAGMKAEQAAEAETAALRRQETRTLLPEAPEDWVMREWNEADRDRLYPPRQTLAELKADAPEEFQDFYTAMENDPQMRAMTEASERMQIADEQRSIRFYERGQSLIALRLDFNRAAGGVGLTGGIQQSAMDIVVGNMTAMSGREGFAVIGGVPYGQQFGLFGSGDGAADPATTLRSFRAQMGPELVISVRAIAPDAHVKDLLGQIDYDTLNKLLTTPLEGVGSDAPALAPGADQAIADAAVNAEAAAIIARGRQSEAELVAIGKGLEANSGSGGLFDMFTSRAAEATAAAEAEAEAAAAAPPAEGTLAALIGGNAPAQAPAEAPAPAQADPVAAAAQTATAATPEVRIRRAGETDGGNCTMTATGKRCSLLGD